MKSITYFKDGGPGKYPILSADQMDRLKVRAEKTHCAEKGISGDALTPLEE